jgi:putative sigma-54 modulation protein
VNAACRHFGGRGRIKEVRMSIEITARHLDATQAMQNHARGRAEAIIAEYPKVEHVHVILDAEKFWRIAEVVVQAKNQHRIEAKESTERMVNSIDAAMDKVEKQLQRLREKIHDHTAAMKKGEIERARGVES